VGATDRFRIYQFQVKADAAVVVTLEFEDTAYYGMTFTAAGEKMVSFDPPISGVTGQDVYITLGGAVSCDIFVNGRIV
jgi:hypothetical protein